jgi:hypothetical protein
MWARTPTGLVCMDERTMGTGLPGRASTAGSIVALMVGIDQRIVPVFFER